MDNQWVNLESFSLFLKQTKKKRKIKRKMLYVFAVTEDLSAESVERISKLQTKPQKRLRLGSVRTAEVPMKLFELYIPLLSLI